MGKITEKQKMNKLYVQKYYGRQAVALFFLFQPAFQVQGKRKKIQLRNFYSPKYIFV